jgi:hypothetical protein
MNQNLKEKTAFFVPNGKKHLNPMPMGVTNAYAAFVAMIAKMEISRPAVLSPGVGQLLVCMYV